MSKRIHLFLAVFAFACCSHVLADDKPRPLNVGWSEFAIAWIDAFTDDSVPQFDAITIHSQSGVSLDFVYIPPGEYIVGRNVGFDAVMARLGLEGDVEEGPRRHIEFENGYYLGRYQVTAEQFATFLNDVDPAIAEKSVVFNRFSNLLRDSDGVYGVVEGASRHPANTVTWEGAVEFTKWFTQETGWSVRLPTEDEWEAAARTAAGFHYPTAGVQERDPETGHPLRPRAGNSGVDVDAFKSNVTANGLWHTLSTLGDWTSDVYVSDRGELWSDEMFAEYDGDGHVLKVCVNNLWEREPRTDEYGGYGMRVLLEATESGSPRRVPPSEPTDIAADPLVPCACRLEVTYSRDLFSDEPWTEIVYAGRNDQYVFVYSFRRGSEGSGSFVLWSIDDQIAYEGTISGEVVSLREKAELTDRWREAHFPPVLNYFLTIVERTDISVEKRHEQLNEARDAQNRLASLIQQASEDSLFVEWDDLVIYDHFEQPPDENLPFRIDELHDIVSEMTPPPKAIDSM